jgi:hypothetical protein
MVAAAPVFVAGGVFSLRLLFFFLCKTGCIFGMACSEAVVCFFV